MLVTHGPNRTELQFLNLKIFISYQTPVAMFDKEVKKIFVTDTKYSNTTTRHINKWIKHLFEQEGLPSKEDSPMSYGKVSEKTLTSIFDLTVTKSRIEVDEFIEEKIKIDTIPSRIGLKERISHILEE